MCDRQVFYRAFHGLFQISDIWKMPPKQAGKAGRKGKVVKEEEVVLLGPKVADGENVFGVAHIFASFNDTFIHVTDYSGKVCYYWTLILLVIFKFALKPALWLFVYF